MEINSQINSSNYMYIRDDTKKILGEKVMYLTTPNCIIVYNKDVAHSNVVKSLKLAIKEFQLIEEQNTNNLIKKRDNNLE